MGKVRIFRVTYFISHIAFCRLCRLWITNFHYFAYEFVFKTGQNVSGTVNVPGLQVKGQETTLFDSFQEKSKAEWWGHNRRLWITRNTRSALFWDFTQCKMLVPCRRFGTTYRSNLQGSTLADETDGLSQSFGKKLPILRCGEPQNKADLIYKAAKAWNHTGNMWTHSVESMRSFYPLKHCVPIVATLL
jgi:hypothetical protein